LKWVYRRRSNRRAGRRGWESRDITDTILVSSVTDFADERNFVEFSLGLYDEGFNLGVTGVKGPRKTWLCLFGGHISDNSAAECCDNCAFLATLEETAK
jgi:hypothetical protein